jgi:putative colanic acid biosynthesis glycosyltransferase WcaI
MRILFLNRSFWPDLEATGQLLAELCEDLSHDHEVMVISGPSYHVATAQRGFLQRDSLGRVEIVRAWGTRFSKQRLSARLLNLGSYYLFAAIGAIRAKRPDVVVVETDPPLLGLLGALLKARWRCRFVYYCQDIYPEIAEATGGVRSRLLLWFLRWANRIAYRHADRIVVLGHDMERRLIGKDVPREKIAVVPNWVDCGAVRPSAAGSFRAQFGGRFVVMYSGNLGLSQRLDAVLEAAAAMKEDDRAAFVITGEGASKAALEKRAQELRLTNVRFFPYQPKSSLSETLGAADLHLIPLKNGAEGFIVPSKLYGVLAVGKPFVAMMDESSDVAVLAKEHRVGFVIPSGDAQALVEAIRRAMSDPAELAAMGRRARELAEQRFDRGIATRKFADVIKEAAA